MTSTALYVFAAVSLVLGGWLIMFGIRNLRGWMTDFDSALLFEMPCSETSCSFNIPAEGTYSLWIKGPRFRVNALIDREPQIREEGSSQPAILEGAVFRTNMTRGRTNVMKIAIFAARKGRHELDLVPAATAYPMRGPGGALRKAERMITRKIAGSNATLADCSLQIRDETRVPGNWVLRGILPILLGALAVGGGIAAGTLTQVLSDTVLRVSVSNACIMNDLEKLTRSLAAAAGGTRTQVESNLGITLQQEIDPLDADAQEFSGKAEPGSPLQAVIESVRLRMVSGSDAPAVLIVMPWSDNCFSMDSVISHFGKAAVVEVAPATSGKTTVLVYHIDGRDIALGFGSEPENRLVSVAVRFNG